MTEEQRLAKNASIKEALYANIPHGRDFFAKMDRCLVRPWHIRKIPIFNSHENNTLTRDIIKLGKHNMLDINPCKEVTSEDTAGK